MQDNSGNDRFSLHEFAVDRSIDARRTGRGVTFEGQDGRFTQTWWPMCRSSELAPGKVLGRGFLDGRVAIFRTEKGVAQVVSAYCPHNGADLSVGEVHQEELRCKFHRWCFDRSGTCTRTGSGDRVPPGARVFAYPTRERFGLIWAFNGETPLFELPDLGYPDDELIFHANIPSLDVNADPWIFMCNTLDFNHIKCVHGLKFEHAEPDAEIRWEPYAVHYPLRAHFADTGAPVSYDLAIHGTNIFWQTGVANGHWFGFLFPAGMHRPGTMRCYTIIAAHKGDGSPQALQAARKALDFGMELETLVVGQDLEILNTIRFNRGHFTRSDRALARFMDHIMEYPRAHPGAQWIK
ncbi:MAG: Rieske (2Fe-2S) protein [Gammaproteobacteria bacterium]|nr:Rieske (2Fe-2S) protein [Gammaproteobacteria bacterium]